MITYGIGDLLKADTQALVNAVNCVGVMGKGIALQFKRTYPETFSAYQTACEQGEVKIGSMFVTRTGRDYGPQYIINFPRKRTGATPPDWPTSTQGSPTSYVPFRTCTSRRSPSQRSAQETAA